MEYNFKEIESKWHKEWEERKIYRTGIDPERPKFYVLDMFPYPSGAGLHVGHPLGYIASDIYTRYKRLCGFNVLHPMGFDAFGLPAEQYAIQTGQHPAITTAQNTARYREQLDKIGFSYDWDRMVVTSDSEYYHWTQWAFLRMFDSYYCNDSQQARPISELIEAFEAVGSEPLNVACTEKLSFTAAEWKAMSVEQKEEALLNYRLAYRADTMVNWCAELGTVLANDEVVGGLSERGGHPVEQKKMKQWSLRVTAYAERLLEGLDRIEWSESLKEIQRNWIGKSVGAQMFFPIKGHDAQLEIFTTRPDTIFGSTFMVIAPEHDMAAALTTPGRKADVEEYITSTKNRSERERMMETKRVSGVFTGSYAVNPFSGAELPIYIADYVLAGYGTGAIMAVPAHDSRDYAFARHFGLEIIPVVEGGDISVASYDAKEGKMINSGLINGLEVKDAISRMLDEIESRGIGRKQVNYRLRDAIFSRQRYWGEPFPIYYKDDTAYPLGEDKLPLELPEINDFRPTRTGEPPLARAEGWHTPDGFPYETSTMPGFAGSSAYSLRYMDPHNDKELVGREANEYWRSVDLYMGGIEHATGHLVYSRFWNKFLFDIGRAVEDEPYRKLVNQGMIQGRSNFAYRIIGKEKDSEQYLISYLNSKGFVSGNDNRFDFINYNQKVIIEIKTNKEPDSSFQEFLTDTFPNYRILVLYTSDILYDIVFKKDNTKARIRYFLKKSKAILNNKKLRGSIFISFNERYNYETQEIHVDINMVKNDILDTDAFRAWRPEFADAEFVLENGKYICGWAVEKMSKSMYNVVNPDFIVDNYGADTLRMYEMFLGPLEASKPWDTNGIDGVHKFLRRLWRLFFDRGGNFLVSDEKATPAELKTLHKTIKKVSEDIENFSFNTSISAFMICLNELGDCNKKEILEPLLVLLSPFAPHITEELWNRLGHAESIFDKSNTYPKYDPAALVESSFEYPVSVNGKLRFKKELPLGLSVSEVEAAVREDERLAQYTTAGPVKKVIVVPGKIINIVI